ncbi:MAG TPA: DUF5668 domain-containing protein [Levilinea sp.]|nr:DUF5668 domain-containing protein [Levilinea sp.]
MHKGRIFWGVIIITAGVLLLLDRLGLLAAGFNAIFWPLVLIVLGMLILFRPVFGRRGMKSEQFSIPLENTTSAEIKLNHGAGRLSLKATGMPGVLLEGSFRGEMSHEVRRNGDNAFVKLSSEVVILPPFTGLHERSWDIAVARSLPIKLHLQSGASENILDLTDLKINELDIETGASSTQVRLPAAAGFTRVEVESGAASVIIQVPEGVAARIYTTGGLSSITVNTQRFPRRDGHYQSPDYESAANRVEMHLEMGVGSIEVR